MCSGIGRINIVKIDTFNAISSREMEKPVFRFIWNWNGPQISKTIFKKNKLEDPHLLTLNFLQSFSNSDSVVLEQGQSDTSVE